MSSALPKADLCGVIAKKKNSAGKTIFIAIDGHGDSGKSTLASWISGKLNAQIIHTDDFASWDNPIDWWLILIDRVLEPIKQGVNTLTYPRSKWWDEHSPESVVDQPVTNIMILEGVSVSRREFRDYISVRIFVEAPKEICLQRGIERDVATGKTETELEEIWNRWFEDEDKYMQRDHPKECADIVVDGTKPFEEQVLV